MVSALEVVRECQAGPFHGLRSPIGGVLSLRKRLAGALRGTAAPYVVDFAKVALNE